MLQPAECLAQAAEAACVFAKPNRWTSGKFRLTSLTGLYFQSTMEYGKEKRRIENVETVWLMQHPMRLHSVPYGLKDVEHEQNDNERAEYGPDV